LPTLKPFFNCWYILSFLAGMFYFAEKGALADNAKSNSFSVGVSKFEDVNREDESISPVQGIIRTTLLPTHTQFVSAKVFRLWLEKYHGVHQPITDYVRDTDVLEIKGTWDNANKPLIAFGLPHKTISAGHLPDYDLSHTKVIIVDCPGTIPRLAWQKVRDFVACGGSLLTTDWALNNLLVKIFPGVIEWNHWQSKSEVVDAEVITLPPSLSMGVVSRAGWKLDAESQTVRILKTDIVKILVRSLSLAHQEPDRQGILAVSFDFGRGHVLHLVGHFDNNAFLGGTNALPDPAPVIGISLRQALAANFVLKALGL